jgi:hypothetical protein
MFKRVVVFITFVSVQLGGIAAPPAQVKIDSESTHRTVCGFKFAPVKHLTVLAGRIPEASLRTRIDNEQYDACPYNVNMKYKGIPIDLEFGRGITLADIKNYDRDSTIRTAYFVFDENGWGAAGDNIDIKKSDIVTQENERSLAVFGIVGHRILNTKEQDFCFSLVVIGEDKYLTAAVCRPAKDTLGALVALFTQQPVITFDK